MLQDVRRSLLTTRLCRICFTVLCGLFLSYAAPLSKEGKRSIIVASYNIWNVMFHWEVRKQYIASMLNELKPDIIGFQEVRAHRHSLHSQLHDLQALSPQYKYIRYEPVNLAVLHEGHQPPGWEHEGIGFLSRHPIVYSNLLNFTLSSGRDRKQRAMLNIQVTIDEEELSLSVVHFSYDKQQQCKNAADVLDYFYSAGIERTIILGDFNTYNSFTWPVTAVISGQFSDEAPDFCAQRKYFSPPAFKELNYNFIDAWQGQRAEEDGLTFSNMPTPGLVSRPDRILVSKTGLLIENCWTLGGAASYARLYSSSLWWTRLEAVMFAAVDNFRGIQYDRTCIWDCGANATCRCGICVEGHGREPCRSGICPECDTKHLIVATFTGTIISVCASYLLCAVCWALLHGGRLSRKARRSIFGNRCIHVTMLLLVTVTWQLARYSLSDTFATIKDQLQQELYPSDHLMVASQLQLSYR